MCGMGKRAEQGLLRERLIRHDTRVWLGASFKEVDVVDHASMVQRIGAAYVPNDDI